jgi:hypothetical protein
MHKGERVDVGSILWDILAQFKSIPILIQSLELIDILYSRFVIELPVNLKHFNLI